MVLIFSSLLILGIISGQFVDFFQVRGILTFSASVCLAYIMMDVGREFSVEKRSVGSYGRDSLIATAAAVLPAVLWFGYFVVFVNSHWKPALLSGLSSAPTSAGVLFAMMTAAGLSAGWVFKKARVLAVLDDLATILLLTPLAIIMYGFEWKAIAALILVGVLLFASFRWQGAIPWPVRTIWLSVYAFVLTGMVFLVEQATHIHLGVLVPAFVWGCLLRLPADQNLEGPSPRISLDAVIKGAFMLLVGLTFPKIVAGSASLAQTAGHVLILTILANVGKLFLVFCYKTEASLKERMALGVAMFPRGEVGAAILLIAIGYGLGGYENTLAILSLALNLVLTGAFIWIVIRLLKPTRSLS
ncbi:MAG: sodium:proton antiporter [Candidatus Omnitrophota bacterium]|nr:sodium:proton antiporter [Candidatus Omnitrophota bacterium]